MKFLQTFKKLLRKKSITRVLCFNSTHFIGFFFQTMQKWYFDTHFRNKISFLSMCLNACVDARGELCVDITKQRMRSPYLCNCIVHAVQSKERFQMKKNKTCRKCLQSNYTNFIKSFSSENSNDLKSNCIRFS